MYVDYNKGPFKLLYALDPYPAPDEGQMGEIGSDSQQIWEVVPKPLKC